MTDKTPETKAASKAAAPKDSEPTAAPPVGTVPNFRVLEAIRHDGERYLPGGSIPIADRDVFDQLKAPAPSRATGPSRPDPDSPGANLQRLTHALLHPRRPDRARRRDGDP
ncbi:hypothetical protein A6302_01468 [Methylobrevis pamukkalensis]|uniref:Uncharacterized protein n=1 Tax=Methylobrevis pamukkalensis TaxID=1439726 RepID=A0A1E3H4C7_9HYPH|nr:hypothetical protein A6302_01468 [Methylobrevis pamukkalensis]